MTASLETLVIAAYVFATSLSIPRPGPEGNGRLGGRPGRHGPAVRKLLPGFFPHLPDQTQYNRRLRRLTPWLTTVQLMVAQLVAEGRVRLVDGTLISCANYPGCASHSAFATDAAYGYCPSKSLYVWGLRLVLIADRKGVPVGYDLVGPKTGEEREAAFRLAQAHPDSLLFGDGGFWGAEYDRTLALIDVELVTPEKHRLGQRPASEIEKARIRLVIESVFSNLKRQMRLDHHLAKTTPGLAQRIIQRLLALTLGIFINVQIGRPPRALAAYDGR
jgi:hypothetical protein